MKAGHYLKYIGPGILVAATGIGAGDLATGAFAGSKLGVAILWAVVIGAFLKYVVIEGLTRWQLATGQTLLEGAIHHLGPVAQYTFLIYLIIWTFFVSSALISASGVAAHALIPVFKDPDIARIVFGVCHSIAALILVFLGTYKSFEKVMSFFISLMFVSVIVTVIMIGPEWTSVLRGVFVPAIPEYLDANGNNQGVTWTLGLMGGVGGTLTLLAYGYWIREKQRTDIRHLNLCRIDLGVAYLVTALFGMAMVIIASQSALDRQASSATLLVVLGAELKPIIGSTGKYIFLTGAWAAVFSSMLGVWQSVPYMFADFWDLSRYKRFENRDPVNTRGLPYRVYLTAMGIIPMIGLQYKFVVAQKMYAVLGSLVLPLIALVLLILNGRSDLVGSQYKNKPLTVVVLLLTIIFFLYLGIPKIWGMLFS